MFPCWVPEDCVQVLIILKTLGWTRERDWVASCLPGAHDHAAVALSHLRVCVCSLNKVRVVFSDPKKDQVLQKYLYKVYVNPKRTSEKVSVLGGPQRKCGWTVWSPCPFRDCMVMLEVSGFS